LPTPRNPETERTDPYRIACPSCGYNLRSLLAPRERSGWRYWLWTHPELIPALATGAAILGGFSLLGLWLGKLTGHA